MKKKKTRTQLHRKTWDIQAYKYNWLTCGVERRTTIVNERLGLFSNMTSHLKKKLTNKKFARALEVGTETQKREKNISMKQLANGILSLDAIHGG